MRDPAPNGQEFVKFRNVEDYEEYKNFRMRSLDKVKADKGLY